MSNDEDQDTQSQNIPSEPTITFEVFEAFHSRNPDLDNAEYYKAFPTVNQGTIRSWKSKARTATTSATPSQQPTEKDKIKEIQQQLYDTLKATASHEAKGYAKLMEDKGDLESAILILQEHAKQQRPAPNMPTIPTPTGMPQIGLAKYMKYNPGSEKISWEIPASVLLDPEKNKKLGEYQ